MATVELTTVLEYSGEDRIDDVDQLILRGAKVVGFNPDVARRLSQLQVLSLSHNLLASLEHFEFMGSLLELNLNFNQLSSLKGLGCPRLQKLYLSHNRIASVDALYGFNSLTVLCLYHNSLIDLPEVLSVLRTLPKLRELDLAGNHCTKDAAAQHEIVTQLPRLRQLDGEAVTGLDRELAEMYFAKHRRRAAQRPSARPSTAPSGGGGGLKATSSFNGAVPLSKDAQLFRSSDLNENAKVIEYLAMAAVNDPFDQASSAASSPASGPGADAGADDGVLSAAPAPVLSAAPRSRGSARGKRLGKAGTLPRPRSLRRLGSDTSLTLASERPPLPSPVPSSPVASGGSSVLGRLRAVRRGRPTSTGSTGSEGLGDSGPEGSDTGASSGARPPRPRARSGGSSQAVETQEMRTSGPGTVGASAGSPAAGATHQASVKARVAASPRRALDPSDPHVTIRKLLKTVEVLQSEREQLQKTVSNLTAGLSDANAGDESDVAALAASGISWRDLVRENQELRAENANMYILKEENAALRHRNTQLLRQLDDNALVLENKRLQSEVREAQAAVQHERRSQLQSAGGIALQRPQTPAEVLADCEDVDAELAQLIKRNQSSLAGIKRDLQAAKREAWSASRGGTGGGAGTAAGSSRPPPTPPGRRRVQAGAGGGRVSPRTSFGRRYRPSPDPEADAAGGAGGGDAVVPDPARALVRPGTPNLLGREIKSAADVQAAYEAVAQAQAQRADLDASRQALLSARGGRVEYAGLSSSRAPSQDGSQYGGDGDGGGGGARAGRKVYTTSQHHTGGADIMVLHEEDAGAGGHADAKAAGAGESDEDEAYTTSSGGEDDDSQGYGSSFTEDVDA